MDPVLRRRRTLVLTVGVTIITVSGALIGATLKSRQQISGLEVSIFPFVVLDRHCTRLIPLDLPLYQRSYKTYITNFFTNLLPKQEQKKKQDTGELNVDQQIALLETTKAQLVKQRKTLETKIAEVEGKAKNREEVERERMERIKKLGSGTAIK